MITRLAARFGKTGLALAALTILLAACHTTIADRPGGSGDNEGAEAGGAEGISGQAGQPGQPGEHGEPGDSGTPVRGSGNVISEARSVNGFASVSLRGSAQLLIDQSGTESLTVEAEDNLLPHLISEVTDGRLNMGPEPGYSIQATKPIIFRLSVKTLNRVAASGSGEIQAKNLKGDDLVFSQSGSFRITAQGSETHSQLTVSGSGDYNGENLDSADVAIDISGSGRAVARASSKLNIKISGSGSVEYLGNPGVNQEISGSGTVRKR